jgi:AcrR family transcriptional regulator
MDSMSTAGTKGVPRAEREQQILDVATDEFGTSGYAGISINAVAAKAGISKPLIYGYFKTKDGLYIACVERAGATLVGAIEDVLVSNEPTLQLASETLRAVFEALAPRPNDWNVIFDRTVPKTGAAADAARRVVAQIGEQASRGVASFLTAGGLDDELDISALTEVWVSSVTALVNWWLRHPDQTAEQMAARSGRILAALAGRASL